MATRMEGIQGTLEALQPPRCLRGEKGIILPLTLLIMLLLTALGGALLTLSYAEIVQGRITQNRLQALNLAEAGQIYARRALTLNEKLDANTVGEQDQIFTPDPALSQPVNWDSSAMLAGLQAGAMVTPPVATGTITIVRHATDPDSAVVTSTAKLGYATKTVEVITRRQTPIPPGVKGAVTARWSTDTNGSITIDGRDHTIDGKLILKNGTFGIYTESTYAQGGNSKIGGTNLATVDHAPKKPGDPSVMVTNAPANSLPDTPDKVMGGGANGFPEGTLKWIAQNGGGQYVTDPALLTYPLSGVTYVELPSGAVWDMARLGDSTGIGIVVVHNSARDAVIQNLSKSAGDVCGCFRGLVIADDIVHIHSTVTGAVVSLTKAPSQGNVIGNGTGKVLFSRAALAGAGALVQKIWPIYAWREVK